MLMQPEDWKKEWGVDNLVFASEHCQALPPIAREFLTSYGLPRRVIFENPLGGDWWEDDSEHEANAYVSYEISFELILQPLDPYNALLVEGDDSWWQQIVIGDEEFCNGRASYCVHQLNETVTRLDVEISDESFVNSTLPQFGESLLLAVRWSNAIHQTGLENWTASLQDLADAIRSIDAEAFRSPANHWPYLIEYALDNEPGFLEITADPKRSKPRF
jgi:hypothetical protein